MLEVGAGTGQATEQPARRGLSVVALEPGLRLADRARSRLAPWPQVSVVTTTFEDWAAETDAFHLLASGTAFHWVDPEIGYPKAAECLVSGGWIALFWNRHVAGDASAPFYEAVAELYRRWAPDLANSFDFPTLDEAQGDERIAESGLFGPVTVKRYGWEERHDARRYTDLLRTYSDHIALPTADREGLLADIALLINDSFGNELILSHATVLYAAQLLK